MKQIDLQPYDYRKQDPETGEMKSPPARVLYRWMAVIGGIFLMYMAFKAHWDGYEATMIIGPAGLGIAVGGLFILSLHPRTR